MAKLMILASLLVLIVGTIEPVPVRSINVSDIVWMAGAFMLVVFLAKVFMRSATKRHFDF